MELSKMVTMSTSHITEETNRYLSNKDNERYFGFVIYEKENYGYFMYLPTDREEDEEYLKELPEDLAGIFTFARNNNIDVVCLDCDGEVLEELPTYEWNDLEM